MFVMPKKEIAKKRSTRLQRMQSHRDAYKKHTGSNPAEQTDITESDLFKTMFKRWKHLRNRPSN